MKELKDMTLEELWRLFPIVLKDHSLEYKTWYEEEKERLEHVLQDHNVYRINHIGSTAVHGLIAKSIIDILLELPIDHDMQEVVRLLEGGGWILMSRDDAQNTLDFNKGYTKNGFEEKVYHLHVKPIGDWGELYFRDYLYDNSEIAREYEALKLSLLERYQYNRDAYTSAKTEFVTAVTRKARSVYEGRYMP